jgi:hypothetical protein
MGFVVDKEVLWQVFSAYLSFHHQYFSHQLLDVHSSSSHRHYTLTASINKKNRKLKAEYMTLVSPEDELTCFEIS